MKGKRLLTAVFMAVITGQIFLSTVVSAQTNGSGLSVSPTRTDLQLDPGGSGVVKVNLRNVTGGDIVAKAFINDFESDNESGQPRIIVDESKQHAASIRDFLVGVTDVSLKKGEEKTFDIPVQIPKNAAPGAYYGVIRYAAVPAGNAAPEPGQVALTASVATIVLIEVAGDLKEQLSFDGIKVYKDDKAAGLFTHVPNRIGLQVTNKGNGFARPFGNVSIKNMFGKEVHKYEVNNTDQKASVLPNSSRNFISDLKGVSLPGRYQILASVSYGDGGEVLIQKKSFWYLPLWFLVLLLIVVLAIVILVYRIRNRSPRTRHQGRR